MKTSLKFLSFLIALFAFSASALAQAPKANNRAALQKEPAKVQVADADCVDKARINTADQCGRVYEPVCGCNGQTYANECDARKNGVLSTVKGECSGSVHEEMRKFLAAYEKAFNAADARSLKGMFAVDATQALADGTLLEGNTAIGNRLNKMLTESKIMADIQILDVISICPSTAYVSGSYQLKNKDDDSDGISGQYVLLCTKTDAAWQITRQNLFASE